MLPVSVTTPRRDCEEWGPSRRCRRGDQDVAALELSKLLRASDDAGDSCSLAGAGG